MNNSTPQSIGVGILGIGVVGGEAARWLAAHNASTGPNAPTLRLIGVSNRSGAAGAERAGIDVAFLQEASALVAHPDVDVIIEAMGGEQPAADLMHRALSNGKHVVSANKEAISKHLPRLVAAANASQVGFLCEASVGGGIPLIVALRQVLATNRVERVRGIVNGTTNFILSKMDAEGADYSATLKEAQELGYAESDPTADVEGFDASYKLAILASLMLGQHVHPDSVDRTGISGVSAEQMAQAQADGGTIRLIASAERDAEGDGIRLKVAPTFIPNDDLFSRVVRNYNAIEITGDRVGSVLLHGQGAGPLPTASALLSDVVEVVRTGAAATPRLRPQSAD